MGSVANNTDAGPKEEMLFAARLKDRGDDTVLSGYQRRE